LDLSIHIENGYERRCKIDKDKLLIEMKDKEFIIMTPGVESNPNWVKNIFCESEWDVIILS
jgi:hypothetical protein